MGIAIDPEGAEVGVLAELVDFAGKDVLEVGCGDGRLTRRYAAGAARVLAIDTDEEEVRAAREQTPPDLLERVGYLVADVAEAELPESAFDVVVLSYSL